MKIINIIIIIVMILLIIMIKIKYMPVSNDDISALVEEPVIEPETISNRFMKMFRDVSPWPGVSQASYKSKTENVNQLS